MVEKLSCPSCGANLTVGKSSGEVKCGYCGASITITEALKSNSQIANSAEIEKSAKSAISFLNSLNVEVKGQRASLVEMWNSLVSDNSIGLDKLTQFYKNIKTQILFCIQAYNRLSEEVKFEIGEFTCAQMESLIKFREENNFIYFDELDDIDAYISKLEYEYGARSFFEFKRRFLIKGQIARVKARRAIVLYDYTLKAVDRVVAKYNSYIEPIKSELNGTSNHGRKKELKFKIESYENTKKAEIERLGLKEITKEYNKVIKKFKIEHEDILGKEVIQSKEVGGVEVPVETKKEETPKQEINYSEMTVENVLDGLLSSLDKLAVGVTKSEIEHCRKLVNELTVKSGKFSQDCTIYCSAIVQSINMILDKEGQPTVLKTMMQTLGGNAKMQINTLKGKLSA